MATSSKKVSQTTTSKKAKASKSTPKKTKEFRRSESKTDKPKTDKPDTVGQSPFSFQTWYGLVSFQCGKKKYLVRGQEAGAGYTITIEDNSMNDLASHSLDKLGKELLGFFQFGSKTYRDTSVLPEEIRVPLENLLHR